MGWAIGRLSASGVYDAEKISFASKMTAGLAYMPAKVEFESSGASAVTPAPTGTCGFEDLLFIAGIFVVIYT